MQRQRCGRRLESLIAAQSLKDLLTRRAGPEHHAVSMCHMSSRSSGRCVGVRRGGADACALGRAKGASWGFVLCLLVLAAASARHFCAQCLWIVAALQVERVEHCVPLLNTRTHAYVVRAPVKSGHLVWTAAGCGRATVRPIGGSEKERYYFSDPRVLRLQKRSSHHKSGGRVNHAF